MERDSLLFCSVCRLAWYKGGLCREHLRHFLPKKGWCYEMALSSLRKLLDSDGKGSACTSAFEDEGFHKKMPSLWEFLAASHWEDGAPRETGTILIFVEDAKIKACLCNRDSGHVGFVTSDTLEGLLRATEKALCDDKVDWRLSRSARQKPGKRS